MATRLVHLRRNLTHGAEQTPKSGRVRSVLVPPLRRPTPGLVEFSLIRDDVRVRPRRPDEIVVPDELTDPAPTEHLPGAEARRVHL